VSVTLAAEGGRKHSLARDLPRAAVKGAACTIRQRAGARAEYGGNRAIAAVLSSSKAIEEWVSQVARRRKAPLISRSNELRPWGVDACAPLCQN